MSPDTPREIAVCWNYEGFIAACRERVKELEISLSSPSAAEITGLHKDHLPKLMSEKSGRCFTPLTLGPLLGLLGMRIVLVEDSKALARLSRRLKKRSMEGGAAHMRGGALHISFSKERLRENGKLGGKKRWEGIRKKEMLKHVTAAAYSRWKTKPKAKRIEHARHAALMRWSPAYRAAQKASGAPD